MRNTLNQFQPHQIPTNELAFIKGGNGDEQNDETANIITEDIMDG